MYIECNTYIYIDTSSTPPEVCWLHHLKIKGSPCFSKKMKPTWKGFHDFRSAMFIFETLHETKDLPLEMEADSFWVSTYPETNTECHPKKETNRLPSTNFQAAKTLVSCIFSGKVICFFGAPNSSVISFVLRSLKLTNVPFNHRRSRMESNLSTTIVWGQIVSFR